MINYPPIRRSLTASHTFGLTSAVVTGVLIGEEIVPDKDLLSCHEKVIFFSTSVSKKYNIKKCKECKQQIKVTLNVIMIYKLKT
jgi:hypothetical protein